MQHMHKYRFESRNSGTHKHMLTGYTEYMTGVGILHLHFFQGVCSYNGHTHYYSGITGLPVKTGNGHIHKMEGILQSNNLHQHGFKAFTSEDTGYVSDKIPAESYV